MRTELKSLDQPTDRNLGIDALRMLAMFFVVLLHVVDNGGIRSNTTWMSFNYEGAWLLTIVSRCCVDCFALISGYVGIQTKPKLSRLFAIWLQTIFYSVGITLVFQIFAPEEVSIETWKAALFPITFKSYWYISAYVGMSLLAPFMNAALKNMERHTVRLLLTVTLACFCVLPSLMETNPFGIDYGYSVVWLCVLYLVGGYMRLDNIPERISPKKAFWGFWLSCGVTFAWELSAEMASALFGDPTIKYRTITFLTPTIVLNAILLLCLFAQIKPTVRMARLIRLFSPAALGVYLIHVHPLIWENRFVGSTAPLADCSVPIMFIGAIAIAIAIYLTCTAIDLVRIRMFAAAHIPALSRRLDMLSASCCKKRMP